MARETIMEHNGFSAGQSYLLNEFVRIVDLRIAEEQMNEAQICQAFGVESASKLTQGFRLRPCRAEIVDGQFTLNEAQQRHMDMRADNTINLWVASNQEFFPAFLKALSSAIANENVYCEGDFVRISSELYYDEDSYLILGRVQAEVFMEFIQRIALWNQQC